MRQFVLYSYAGEASILPKAAEVTRCWMQTFNRERTIGAGESGNRGGNIEDEGELVAMTGCKETNAVMVA